MACVTSTPSIYNRKKRNFGSLKTVLIVSRFRFAKADLSIMTPHWMVFCVGKYRSYYIMRLASKAFHLFTKKEDGCSVPRFLCQQVLGRAQLFSRATKSTLKGRASAPEALRVQTGKT